MRAHRVRALLMGGQACVFCGAAEFSRDTDFAILATPRISKNLRPQPPRTTVAMGPGFETLLRSGRVRPAGVFHL
jgi:hypothetical protein